MYSHLEEVAELFFWPGEFGIALFCLGNTNKEILKVQAHIPFEETPIFTSCACLRWSANNIKISEPLYKEAE